MPLITLKELPSLDSVKAKTGKLFVLVVVRRAHCLLILRPSDASRTAPTSSLKPAHFQE